MKPLYIKKNGQVEKVTGAFAMPATYPAANVEYDNTVTSELQATDVQGAIDELSTRQDTNTKNTAYGTCDTAGNVKDKVATLSNATNWVLEVGTIVGIRFTYTNTYAPSSGNAVTLNVNNTGAKNIRYGDGVGTGTGDIKNPTAYGEAGQTIYYMYDGTYWVWVSHSKDNDTLYNFVGREFRSCNFQDAGLATGFGGDANLMVVNGVYYYNSNGPSTSIGASANDGSVFVHVCDDGYVVQIAQNYETGNIFVRAMNNNVWGEWKKPIGNIAGNNAVLTTDKTPFLTRQTLNPTGFSGYVREKLVGASYAWNQLCHELSSTYWTTENGSVSYSSGIATFTASATNGRFLPLSTQRPSFIQGHIYLFIATLKTASATTSVKLVTGFTNTYTNGSTSRQSLMSMVNWTSNSGAWPYPTIVDERSSGWDAVTIYGLQLVDLTLAFGSTIADYLYSLTNNGGITKLRDMGFPIDKYTPYGYGLYSVKTSGKKIVGKNLCEETIINATIGTDGTITTSGGASFDMHVARVLQGVTYTIKSDEAQNVNQQFVGGFFYSKPALNSVSYNGTRLANTSATFTSPITGYVAFRTSRGYAVAQCECGSSQTTYEPYSSTTYPLGNDELRGKFDLVNGEIVASGDVKESNGGINRKYGIINLGTIDYIKYDVTQGTLFRGGVSGIFRVTNSDTRPDFVCSKYVTTSSSGRTNLSISQPANQEVVDIVDSNYSDVTTFKNAMNGVYLVYPLATSTTEQSTPFADPMSLVGATTEEYIDNRDIPCPVGAERQYMGQSEDVVEIPSSPLSDGKRKLVAETSGGKTQYYFEDDKNGAGTQVNLMTYNTSTNKYVCPSDGYISLSNAGASVGDYIIMSVYGANDNLICGLRCDTPVASMVTAQSLFVKRGMKCYVRATSSTGSFTALFTPLA